MPDYPTTPLTPDATTARYGLPLWGANQPADVGRTTNETARAVDSALALAVARVASAERHYAFLTLGA